MADSLPPSSRPAALSAKRPWYLVLALSIAFFVGAVSTMQGCQTFAIYQGAYPSASIVETIPTENGRKQVEEGYSHYTDVLFAAKSRAFPLNVASWVFGIAIMAFAMRALSGSRVARNYMLQVLTAAGLIVASEYWLIRDVGIAEVQYRMALQGGVPPQMPSSPSPAELARAVLVAGIALKLFAVGAILVALTRARTKAFYDAVALTERNSSP